MRPISKPALGLFIAVSLSACSHGQDGPPNLIGKADAEIAKSFAVSAVSPEPAGPATIDRARVTLKTQALEKEFLLQANLSVQDGAPQFEAQRSRIVFFHRVDAKIYMLESTAGKNLTPERAQTLPLAEFPILSETAEGVTIDFNAGMSQLFVGSDWAVRDFGAGQNETVAVRTKLSYIDRAELKNGRDLEIHQKALAELPVSGVNIDIAAEMVYDLTPYRPNPNFAPTLAPTNLDHLGFFEVAGLFTKHGGVLNYAAKHDASKPIVFALSASTPAEYRGAIRDGVLYWNRDFGRDVVKVIDAPEGESAPSLGYNLIEWVNYDSATFAYADAQMDPRTGEVLHHQIYLTNGFVDFTARSLDKLEHTGIIDLGLRGFKSSSLCKYRFNDTAATEFETFGANLTPAQKQKAIQDTYREIVAHEVGHVLGLRHNFAGSLAANYLPEAREKLLGLYLEEGSTPEGVIASSSVMDYHRATESVLIGDQIAKGTKALAYDEKAIQALYFGHKFQNSELPLFCTDSSEYADCLRFDAGNSHVAWTKYEIAHGLASIPFALLQRFTDAKTGVFDQPPVDLADLKLRPERTAMILMEIERRFVDLFRQGQRLLSVERQFAHHEDAETPMIRARTLEVLRADLLLGGKLENIFPAITPTLTDELRNQFEALLDRPELLRGKTTTGKEFAFTADDVLYMREAGRRFFDRLLTELSLGELAVLAGRSPRQEYLERVNGPDLLDILFPPPTSPFDDSDLSKDLAQHIARRAVQYLFSTTGLPDVFRRESSMVWTSPGAAAGAGNQDAITLTLPHFAYPLEMRKRAATLLGSGRAESPAWGFVEKRVIEQQFDLMVSQALPGLTAATEPGSLESLPPEMVRWLLEAREIESLVKSSLGFSLPNMPSSGPRGGAGR